MADEDLSTLLTDLHAHLDATAERPLPETANRWLGEATAVAADVADGDAPPEAIRRRAGQVRDLLANVESTGDEAADEHVAAADALAAEVLARLDDGA